MPFYDESGKAIITPKTRTTYQEPTPVPTPTPTPVKTVSYDFVGPLQPSTIREPEPVRPPPKPVSAPPSTPTVSPAEKARIDAMISWSDTQSGGAPSIYDTVPPEPTHPSGVSTSTWSAIPESVKAGTISPVLPTAPISSTPTGTPSQLGLVPEFTDTGTPYLPPSGQQRIETGESLPAPPPSISPLPPSPPLYIAPVSPLEKSVTFLKQSIPDSSATRFLEKTLDTQRYKKLVASTSDQYINENTPEFRALVSNSIDAYSPSPEKLRTDITTSLQEAGYTPENFQWYQKSGVNIEGFPVGKNASTYNDFVNSVIHYQQGEINTQIIENVRTNQKILRYGDFHSLGIDSEILTVIDNAGPKERKILESTLRNLINNPPPTVPSNFVGPLQKTSTQLAFEKAYSDAFGTLSYNQQKTHNLKYLDFKLLSPEEILQTAGGKEWFNKQSSSKQKSIVNSLVDSSYFQNYVKTPEGNSFVEVLLLSRDKTKSETTTKVVGGTPIPFLQETGEMAWRKLRPETPADIKSVSPQLAEYMLSSGQEQWKKALYDDLHQSVRTGISGLKGLATGVSAVLTFPEFLVEEVGGRIYHGIKEGDILSQHFFEQAPAQVIPKHVPFSREFIGKTIEEEFAASYAPPGISATIGEGISQLSGKGESEAWQRAKEYPTESFAGALGEISGMYYGGKAMGLGYKGAKTLTSKQIQKLKGWDVRKGFLDDQMSVIARKTFGTDKHHLHYGKTGAMWESSGELQVPGTMNIIKGAEWGFLPGRSFRPIGGQLRGQQAALYGAQEAGLVPEIISSAGLPSTVVSSGVPKIITEVGGKLVKGGQASSLGAAWVSSQASHIRTPWFEKFTGAGSRHRIINLEEKFEVSPTGLVTTPRVPSHLTIPEYADILSKQATIPETTKILTTTGSTVPFQKVRAYDLPTPVISKPIVGESIPGTVDVFAKVTDRAIIKIPLDKELLRLANESGLIVTGSTSMLAQAPTSLARTLRKIGDWDFVYDGSIAETKKAALDFAKKLGKDYTVKELSHKGTFRVYKDNQGIADITALPETGYVDIPPLTSADIVTKGTTKFVHADALLARKIEMAKYGKLGRYQRHPDMPTSDFPLGKTIKDIGIATGKKGKDLDIFRPRYQGLTLKASHDLSIPKRIYTKITQGYSRDTYTYPSSRLTYEGIEPPIEWSSFAGHQHAWMFGQSRRPVSTLVKRKPELSIRESPISKYEWVEAKDTYDYIKKTAKIQEKAEDVIGFPSMRQAILPDAQFSSELELGVLAGTRKIAKPAGWRPISVIKGQTPKDIINRAYERYGDFMAQVKGYRDIVIIPSGKKIQIRGYESVKPSLSKFDKLETGKTVGKKVIKKVSKKVDKSKIIDTDKISRALTDKSVRKSLTPAERKEFNALVKLREYAREGVPTYKPLITPRKLVMYGSALAGLGKGYPGLEKGYSGIRQGGYIYPGRPPTYRYDVDTYQRRPSVVPEYPRYAPPEYDSRYPPGYTPPRDVPRYEPPRPEPRPPRYASYAPVRPYRPTYYPQHHPLPIRRRVPPPLLPKEDKKKSAYIKKHKPKSLTYTERKFYVPSYADIFRPTHPQKLVY